MSFNRTSLYRREVRIFVADCFPGSRPERHALMRQVLHKLRQHCDTLHVSVTIVDLLFQVPCDATAALRGCRVSCCSATAAQGCGAPYVTQSGLSSLQYMNSTRELDLAELVRMSLLEIEECRPFVVGLLGQSYGWIPSSLPLWYGLLYPWLRSYQNNSIPNDRGIELVSAPSACMFKRLINGAMCRRSRTSDKATLIPRARKMARMLTPQQQL